jgi:hypothetical protein
MHGGNTSSWHCAHWHHFGNVYRGISGCVPYGTMPEVSRFAERSINGIIAHATKRHRISIMNKNINFGVIMDFILMTPRIM